MSGAAAASLPGILVRRPKTVLTVVAALTIVLGWQARQFHIDASPDTLLTPDNEHYLQTRLVSQRFSTRETLIVAYQPTGHTLLSRKTFDDLNALSRRISALERVDSVRSLDNVPVPGTRADAPLTALDDVATGSSSSHREPPYEQLAEALRGHPIYEGVLVDAAQTVTALHVVFAPDPELSDIRRRMLEIERQSAQGELSEAQEAELERLGTRADPLARALSQTRDREMRRIRDIAADYEIDANLYIGGIHALEHGLVRIIGHDVVVFGTAIAVAICVMLLVLFRSVLWMLVPVILCAASVTCTIGLFALLELDATVISANFVALQLILTLAMAMHLLIEYQQTKLLMEHQQPAAARPSAGIDECLQVTWMRKLRPCVYAGITTSVGFAALLVSGIQPVISFGWMMIVAMMVSLSLTLLLFPALVAVLRPGRPARTGGRMARGALEWLAGLATRNRVAVLLASAAVFLWGVSGAFLLELENSFLSYFDESTRLHRELEFIDRHLGGTTPLDVVYTIPERERQSDLVLTADTVHMLQRIHQRLERHEAVGKVLSVTSFTALARRLNDDRPLTETELTAAYRLMPEDVRNDLIGGFLAAEEHQVRFSARIQDTTPDLDRGALLAAIRGDLKALGVPEDRYTLSNLAVLYEDILSRLFTSQLATVAVVLVALTVAFRASFGSLPVALAALIPNVLAATTVFGVMGWLSIELDVMTITIAAVTIGIAVDDTIHYVHRYLDAGTGASAQEATFASHRSVGFAILYTTVIITLGFSLLTLSDFVPSVLFGALTALAMLVALVADLTLLPVVLAHIRRRESP